MKLWGSVRQGAAKVAFEADKMVKVRKQEQAIADVEKQVREQYTSLGEGVLKLYRESMIDHPTIAAAHEQMSALEQQIDQLQRELEQIKAEEYVPETPGAAPSVTESSGQPATPPPPVASVAPAAPVQSVPPSAPAPLAPVAQSAPEPAAAAEVRHCTNCGATLPDKGAFCPECGQPTTPAE
ncbi:MAG: hypothetical protein GXY68_01395 [Chloroflexi bacterium]|nr:hypothetical protein [Chloroflexota bacterium]